jgi:hypothetical protein
MIRLREGYIGHLPSTSGTFPTDTFLMCSLAGVTTGFDFVRHHNGVPHIMATGGHRPGTISKSSCFIRWMSSSLFFWRFIDIASLYAYTSTFDRELSFLAALPRELGGALFWVCSGWISCSRFSTGERYDRTS